MGYRTEADERLDSAAASVQSAIECLSEVVVTKSVSGSDEYQAEYKAVLNMCLYDLMKIRDRMAR